MIVLMGNTTIPLATLITHPNVIFFKAPYTHPIARAKNKILTKKRKHLLINDPLGYREWENYVKLHPNAYYLLSDIPPHLSRPVIDAFGYTNTKLIKDSDWDDWQTTWEDIEGWCGLSPMLDLRSDPTA